SSASALSAVSTSAFAAACEDPMPSTSQRKGHESDSSSELSSCCAGGEKSNALMVCGPAQYGASASRIVPASSAPRHATAPNVSRHDAPRPRAAQITSAK